MTSVMVSLTEHLLTWDEWSEIRIQNVLNSLPISWTSYGYSVLAFFN